MKRLLSLLAILALLVLPAASVFAGTTDVPPTWQGTLAQAITGLTPVLVPVLVYYFRQLLPRIKPVFLPVLAVVLGAGLDIVNQVATSGGKGMIAGALLGALGIGLREIADQLQKAWKGV